MGEHFTASQGFIVAEIAVDANHVNGAGRLDAPILMVLAQMLFRSSKEAGTTYDFREIQCRISPFEGTYIATSLPARLNLILGPGHQVSNHSVYLEIPFDQRRLALINRLRNGGDVKLRLDMELFADELLEVGGMPKRPPAFGLVRHHHMRTSVQLEIPKSKWVERVLEQSGFGKVHIIELPVIPIESCAEFQAAYSHLQQAFKLESQGFYDEAVATCRKALEPFFERVTQTDGRKAFALKSSWKTRLGEATYRWLNDSLIAVKQGTDTAHHLSSASFDQMEAQMLLTVATSIIVYAAKTRPDG